jgi:DNA (cytosine-5)-methyltransferase 1
MSQHSRGKVVDLFSGAGGMSHGFYRYRDRFEIIGAVDLEKGKPGRGKSPGTSTACNPTYERNIGVRPKNADLSVLSPSEYRGELGIDRGDLEVLISCAPCTGFSQKNASNHIRDDPRNLLVERTADFVAEFMPEFLVMENVKELLNGNQRHHFDALRRRLEDELGYSVWAEVHDLSDYGLAQRRVRAMVVARRDGPVVGLPWGTETQRTVRDTIAHLPPIEAGQGDPCDPMHVAPRNTPKVLDRIRAMPKDGGSWADIMNDPNRTEEEKRYLLIPAMFRARPGSFPDVYGRLWWDRPAITITRECGHVGNGRYVHPEQDRLLSVREMALLQGFPPDYHFEGRLTAKYNQIGDAVPPLVAAKIAEHITRLQSGELNVYEELASRDPQYLLMLKERRELYMSPNGSAPAQGTPNPSLKATKGRPYFRRTLSSARRPFAP